jgi:hypothetical protein
MHRAIAKAISQSKRKLSTSIVGGKAGVTVILSFSEARPFPEWVAKVGTGSGTSPALKREFQALELVSPWAEELGAPRALDWDEDGGSACLIVSGVDGFSEHFGLRDERSLKKALEWLERLRARLTAKDIESKLGPVDDLAWLERRAGEQPPLARLHERLRKAGRHLLAPAHGDFWCGNLLFTDERLGVIDWEGLSARPALHDVFSLLTHCSFRVSGRIQLDVTAQRFFELFFSNGPAALFVREVVANLKPTSAELDSAFYSFVAHSLRIKGGRYRESWLEILTGLDQRGFPSPWSP